MTRAWVGWLHSAVTRDPCVTTLRLYPHASRVLVPHVLRVQFALLSKVNALVPYTKSFNSKIRVAFIVCPSIVRTGPSTRTYSHDHPHSAHPQLLWPSDFAAGSLFGGSRPPTLCVHAQALSRPSARGDSLPTGGRCALECLRPP